MATITGTDGNDNLNGGAGADLINGDDGNDKISGGAGSDSLYGDAGNDTLNGGSGGDTLDGGSGNDTLNGDSGNDILIYKLDENAGSSDVYTGGSGIDTIQIMLTNTEQWLDPVMQEQISKYVQHLAAYTNAKTLELSNGSSSDFTFNFTEMLGKSTTLKVQMTETLEIYINGKFFDYNDASIIPSSDEDTSVIEAGSGNATTPAALGDGTAGGKLTVYDLNAGQAVFAPVTADKLAGDYGSFSFDSATGAWTYTLDNSRAATQALIDGQEATDELTVSSADGKASQVITVNITGSNDAATITASAAEDTTVVEAGAGNATTPAAAGDANASGKLTVSDVDAGQAAFAAVAEEQLTGTYGTFTFNSATGAWTYALDQAKANALIDGEEVTDELTVSSVDGTASQVITVNITGSNDAATITASAAEDTTVVEAGAGNATTPAAAGDANASGKLTVSDVDAGQAAFAAVAEEQLTGTYGTFTFNSATGAWTYALDQAKANALIDGEEAIDELTVSSADGTASQVITVNITGSNDAATITASAAEDTTVVEAGAGNATTPAVAGDANASGKLTVSDVDAGQAAFAAVAEEQLTGTYGTFTFNSATGAWTYALDQAKANALIDGEEVTDELTVSSVDGTASQVITVNITGSNDAATITASAAEDTTVVEAGAGNATTPAAAGDANASGKLTVSDVDAGQAAFAAVAEEQLTGTYGTFTFNSATGAWTYALDQAKANALIDGEEAIDELTVSSADGTASQVITVNITGSNDAATITASAAEDTTVVEAGAGNATTPAAAGDANASGKLTVSDVDAGQAAFAAVAEEQLTGTYGTFTFNSATGAWTYALDQAKANALIDGEEVTDELTVSSVDGTASQVITVNITGSNDAATITASAAEDTTVVEAGAGNATTPAAAGDANASGKLTVSDVDAGQAAFAAVAEEQLTGTYGTFTFNSATGAWTYALDQAKANALIDGEEATDELTVSSVDGTASQVITVNITGGNDAATITGTATGAVTEDGEVAGTANASGKLTVSDVDAGQAAFAAVAEEQLTGTYGTFTFNSATGAWTYALDQAKANALIDGEEAIDELTVSSADGTASQVITVNITGSNDAATITASAAEDTTVVEAGAGNATTPAVAGDANASGKLTVSDVDAGQAAFAAVAEEQLTGTYGNFTFNSATGAWTYALDQAKANALIDGEEAIDELTVSSVDGTASQVITVNITGSNDAATITASAAEDTTVVEAGAGNATTPAAAGDANASGKLTVSDVDAGQAAFAAVAEEQLTGTYGTFTFNSATGAWTYALDQAKANALIDGEEVTDELTVSSVDGTASQVITVNITGSNDAATITASAAEDTTVVEAGAGNATTPAAAGDANASGKLTVSDVDAGQAAFAAVAEEQLTGTYGTFTFNSATGAWTYALDQAKANALIDGEEAIDELTVSSVDGTASQVITVNITGSNDAAAITGTATGEVIENGINASGAAIGDATAGGTLTVSDVDSGENHFATPASLAGVYGTFALDTTSGAWTYALDNARTATQALTAGQPVTDTLTVSSADGTASQIITVNITGSNDAAAITGTATGEVIENGINASGAAIGDATAGGTLTVSDVDSGENHFATPASLAGVYGTFALDTTSGAWTYALDNARTATQALTAGQPVTDTLTVSSADGTASQIITVNITGSNDAAAITGTATGEVIENGINASGAAIGDATAGGTLTVSDVDSGENHFATPASLAGVYGTFALDTTSGAWTYALDNARTATQALTAGQPVTDTLTVSSADGTASQVITVNITGGNDAATITGTATGAVTEDGEVAGTANASGKLTVSDVDAGQAAFAAVAEAELTGTYGTFTFNNATGAWTYALDQAKANELIDGEEAIDELTVSSADGTASQVITVNITGSNDAATISSDSKALTEGSTAAAISTSGTLAISDADAGEAHVVAQNVTTAYGTFAINSDGAWTYAASSAHDELTAGQVVTETFTVKSQDDTGTGTVTITITGTNDAPMVAAALTSTAAEGSAPYTLNLLAGATDADASDQLNVTSISYTVDGVSSAAPSGVTLTGNSLSVDPTNGAFNHLAVGESNVIVASYTVTDGHGGTVNQTEIITITGTNDVVRITSGAQNGAIVEDASTLTATGAVAFTDVDLSDSHAATFVAATGNTTKLGNFTLASVSEAANAANGSVGWTYTLDNTAAQYLSVGQTVTETYTVTVSDGHGSTATQDVIVTITGAADGPLVANDNIITNVSLGATFSIPEWALLANDGTSATDVVSALGSVSGLSVSHTDGNGSNGTISVTDTTPAGGSFTYQATDGTSAGASAAVNITQDINGALDGTSGNDILVSGSGGATLVGGGSNDILLGGGGNDTYVFGLDDGNDIINDAGSGNDAINITTLAPTDSTAISTLNFERVNSDLVIQVGATNITVDDHFANNAHNVESITFTNGGTVYGYKLSTASYNLSTDLSGGGQADVIASSSAGDIDPSVNGGNGNDLLFGNGGADIINGVNGNDLLVGGAGNDRLIGGDGNDVLVGGSDADTFVFNTGLNIDSNVDQIQDFSANGVDLIELSAAIFKNIGTGGTLLANDFASLDGTGASGSVATEVNIIYDSRTGNLYYDSDGGSANNRSLFAHLTIQDRGVFDNNDIKVG